MVVYYLLIAIHEYGHVFTGWLVGYSWQHIVIGPIKLVRNNGSIRIAYSGQLRSGEVLPAANSREVSRSRATVLLSGGPLANLVVCTVILVLFLHLPADKQDSYWILSASGLMSLYFFVISVIPYRRATFKNDAMLILELWGRNSPWILHEKQRKRYNLLLDLRACRNNGVHPHDWDEVKVKAAVILRDDSVNELLANLHAYCWADNQGLHDEACIYRERLRVLSKLLGTGALGDSYAMEIARYVALTEIYAAIQGNARPRDWDSDSVTEAMAIHDQSSDEALACYYAYAWALDHGRSQDAGDYLDKALGLRETCSIDTQRNIMLEAAYLEAFIRENPTAARAWFDQAEPVDEVRLEYLISESAVLLAEGEKDAARAKAEEALVVCKPEQEFEREILEKILARC